MYNALCSEEQTPNAGVAHPVERHLAKVEVASSSLVTRSINAPMRKHRGFFMAPLKGKLSPQATEGW